MQTASYLWDDWAIFTIGEDIWLDKKHWNPTPIPEDPDSGAYGPPPIPGDWSLDALHLGSDPLAVPNGGTLFQLGAKLRTGPLPALPLNQVLAHYVLGFQCPGKGLRMTRRGVKLYMGDYRDVLNDPFSNDHPAFDTTLRIRRQDYAAHVARGTPIEVLRRWNGYDLIKLFGSRAEEHLSRIVPPGRESDGSRPPRSTFGDTFTDTDDVVLTDHTPTGANAGTGWTMNSNTAEIISNRATNLTDPVLAQMADDLSSDDHEVICTMEMTTAGAWASRFRACASRIAATGQTCYFGGTDGDATTPTTKLYYWAAGTKNELASQAAGAGTTNALHTHFADGSSLSVIRAADAELTATDTNITGNLRGGIAGQQTGANRYHFEDFSVADLVAAPTGRVMGALAGLGGLAGAGGLAGRGGGIAG